MYGGLLAGRGRVAMARGDPVEAVELLEQTGRSVIGSPVANPAVLPWRSYLSSARLAVGDVEGARAAASEELELARRFGAPRPLGVALRAAGAAEGGERGVGLLGEAVHVLRRSPSELELARALIELGAAVRRRGQSVDAREHLREGAEMARRFGAVVMEQRAHRELLAAGAKPRRRESIGLGALTPGERRVAEMAAEGLTNRQIAQSLFVTVKAVQWHLRNAYRKLDVASREELPAVLRGASP
jgi:DNA-binding CsgD family transcriptional regulator